VAAVTRWRFSAARWLKVFEATGGRFLIVGAGAVTLAASPRSRRLERVLLADRRRWVAVYQWAAARGPTLARS